MPTIPSAILKQIYRRRSLANHADGYSFTMRNHLASANVVGLRLRVDGAEVPAERIAVEQNGAGVLATSISAASPLRFSTGVDTVVKVSGEPLPAGKHSLQITADTREIGPAIIDVTDEL